MNRLARVVCALWCVGAFGCGDDDAGGADGGSTDAGRLDAGHMDAGRDDGGADGGGADASQDVGADGGGDDAGLDAATDVGTDGGAGRDVEALLRDLRDGRDADAVIADVARREGWPLRDGDRYIFLTRWDDAPGDVSVVGDFNEFVAGADPAERLGSGVHYLAVVTIPDADAVGAKWKWHGASGDVFRAPPEATRYDRDEFGLHGYVLPPMGRPWFERFPDFGAGTVDARWIRVRMPADFTEGPAPVLLLHDGQNVFDPGAFFGGWRVPAALSGDHAGVLAVAVDNGPDRFDTYTHVPDTIGAGGPVGGRADDYLDVLEDEVLPFVRARYGVVAAGDNLMMMGSSLGGLVTLHAARSRPALAGCVGAMSSTLGWGAFAADGSQALVNQWATRGPVAIYLDSGGGGTCRDLDADGVQEDSDDSDNFCTTSQLRDHLDGLGYEFGVDLAHWHEPGAPHNEAAWAARVPRALDQCRAFGWR